MLESLDRYDFSLWDERQPIRWPDGARLAFWVAPNIEFYELQPEPNPARRAWPRPLPDVQGYATRDYGNRVGHIRMMQLLDRYEVRGSISLSTALCEHHPEIIELCLERNWEFFSHGIYNTRYAYGMDEDQEREMIEDSVRTIRKHTGQACAGYLAPALTHTERTLDLFAEAGGIYTCDLFHDDQPTRVRVRNGKPFVSVPYSLELNDTIAYVVHKIEPRRYGAMIKAAFDRLYMEGAASGTVMCVPLHAYQVSHPHRMAAFEEALAYITSHKDIWVTTGREIAEYYIEHYFSRALESASDHSQQGRDHAS